MPKFRTVTMKDFPLAKLVLENTESIASGGQIEILLSKFNRWEEIEDELKEKLRRWMAAASDEYRSKLAEVLKTIEEIDKAQDEIIETIWALALHIERINRKSNELLKPHDIRGRYGIKQLFHLPLFGETVIRRWGSWRVERRDSKDSSNYSMMR